MKILFIVPRLDKASSRYRVIQYIHYLEMNGIECEVVGLPGNQGSRLALWWKCMSHDIVFLQKRLLSSWDFYCLRRFSKKLVFDFDDAIMFSDKEEGSGISKSRIKKFRRTINKADLIIAGNAYLKECALKLYNFDIYNSDNEINDAVRISGGRIKILATPIDINKYKQKEYSEKNTITIGWIGSHATLHYLEDIKVVFEKLVNKYPNLVLRIVSDKFIDIKTVAVEKIPWSKEGEIEDLHGMDIGIMPLSDNAWTKGKCSFKLLQYMAVGMPVVCSPVGMNRDVVIDGENGFWAEDEKDWVSQISRLIESSSLRKKMGMAGRKRIQEDYSLEKYAVELARIFRES